jgi:hypothetical protein
MQVLFFLWAWPHGLKSPPLPVDIAEIRRKYHTAAAPQARPQAAEGGLGPPGVPERRGTRWLASISPA